MTTKKDKLEEERESALVSLFGIHQTKDPDNIIRKSMERVLETYTQRVLSQQNSYLRSEVEKMKVKQAEDSGAFRNENIVISGDLYRVAEGYNQALEDVLKMMSEKHG